MPNIQEVSLGFAEFVSQLIQETFDAILSSQNYQLERYAELQSRLELPNEAYRQAYSIDDKVEQRIQQYFGFTLDRGTPVNQALNDFLEENFDDSSTFVDADNLLTQEGYEAVEAVLIDLIITEEKTMLNALLNQSNVSKLVVDSGEITAKLELSSLFASDEPTGGDTGTGDNQETKNDSNKEHVIKNPRLSTSPKNPTIGKGDSVINKGDAEITTGNIGTTNELFLPSYNQDIRVLKFQNNLTGTDTLLIDRNQFDRLNSSNVSIPNVRLTAQPTKLTTNSNLYSEIKISFKTV